MNGDVMISVDPRSASNTAAAMDDPVTKMVLAGQQVADTTTGYRSCASSAGLGGSGTAAWRAATHRAGRCPAFDGRDLWLTGVEEAVSDSALAV